MSGKRAWAAEILRIPGAAKLIGRVLAHFRGGSPCVFGTSDLHSRLPAGAGGA
ncbi:MAG: hypothetical protein RR234_10070 [Christensenella sp.]